MSRKSFRLMGAAVGDRNSAQCDQSIFESRMERFLTKRQLADNLNISVGFVNKLVAEEGLPRLKLGKAVRFQESEVMAFLNRRKRP